MQMAQKGKANGQGRKLINSILDSVDINTSNAMQFKNLRILNPRIETAPICTTVLTDMIMMLQIK